MDTNKVIQILSGTEQAIGNANVMKEPLQLAIAALRNVERMEKALRAWIKWEGELILCREAWGNGNGLPKFTQELMDKYLELQGLRWQALEGGTVVIDRPTIVCLCGSTRFGEAFQKANLEETLAGKIVLSIGCNMKSDDEIFGHLPEDDLRRIKEQLDELHFRKIEMADEVLILNIGGYIGESTGRELAYARKLGKVMRFLEPEEGSDTDA